MKIFTQATAFCPSAFCNTAFQIEWVDAGGGRRSRDILSRERLLREDEELLSVIVGFVVK